MTVNDLKLLRFCDRLGNISEITSSINPRNHDGAKYLDGKDRWIAWNWSIPEPRSLKFWYFSRNKYIPWILPNWLILLINRFDEVHDQNYSSIYLHLSIPRERFATRWCCLSINHYSLLINYSILWNWRKI